MLKTSAMIKQEALSDYRGFLVFLSTICYHSVRLCSDKIRKKRQETIDAGATQEDLSMALRSAYGNVPLGYC